MSDEDVQRIIHDVRERLDRKGRERGLALALEDEGYQIDEDWVYLCVTPAQENFRAYDYAEILGEIEKDLRREGIDNVLLVPALDE